MSHSYENELQKQKFQYQKNVKEIKREHEDKMDSLFIDLDVLKSEKRKSVS